MPFSIKNLKSEFEGIKQELKKFQGGSSGSGGQGQQYPGQGQPPYQQGYYPGQQSQPQYQQYPGQQSQYPPQQQYQQYPGPQQHQQQQQYPGYPPPSQGNNYPPPPGQHAGGYPPPPGQHAGGYPPPPHQQQQYSSPPVPHGSRPGMQSPPPPPHPNQQHQQYLPPGTYWQARFDPSTPVSAEWEHKLGNNNGWGNAELQHYTDQPQNSFYTPDRKLVIRAISQPNHQDGSQKYTSARLVSRQRLGRSSGCLTAVITNPSAHGVWPAFWLLPAEPFQWPNDGEVDISESWNSDPTNHTCLHWGHFTPSDSQKHRVVETPLPGLNQRAVKFEFAWQQDESTGAGRMMWWIDGNPVMKADIPPGLRRLRDWCVIINIAMGGNVNQGRAPNEGSWDMVIHEVRFNEQPDGGWQRMDGAWSWTKEGHGM